MRLFLVIIPLLLSFSQTGCASLGVRTGMYSRRADLYPATAVDAGILAYVATKPFVSPQDPTFSPDAQEGIVYLFVPASIIDLPLAVAVDTLLLPYDIHKARQRKSDHDAKIESLRSAGPIPVPSPTLQRPPQSASSAQALRVSVRDCQPWRDTGKPRARMHLAKIDVVGFPHSLPPGNTVRSRTARKNSRQSCSPCPIL